MTKAREIMKKVLFVTIVAIVTVIWVELLGLVAIGLFRLLEFMVKP